MSLEFSRSFLSSSESNVDFDRAVFGNLHTNTNTNLPNPGYLFNALEIPGSPVPHLTHGQENPPTALWDCDASALAGPSTLPYSAPTPYPLAVYNCYSAVSEPFFPSAEYLPLERGDVSFPAGTHTSTPPMPTLSFDNPPASTSGSAFKRNRTDLDTLNSDESVDLPPLEAPWPSFQSDHTLQWQCDDNSTLAGSSGSTSPVPTTSYSIIDYEDPSTSFSSSFSFSTVNPAALHWDNSPALSASGRTSPSPAPTSPRAQHAGSSSGNLKRKRSDTPDSDEDAVSPPFKALRQSKNSYRPKTGEAGEKKFWCELCPPRTFFTKSKGDLNRHKEVLSHGPPRYVCVKCTERFTRKDALVRHTQVADRRGYCPPRRNAGGNVGEKKGKKKAC